MKDNCYVYVIDLSLRKGKIGQYSEALVFECQPFLSSHLGGNSKWSYKKAFAKAFPHAHMKIDVQGNLTHVVSDKPSHRILIKLAKVTIISMSIPALLKSRLIN
jgi:hypothetical protein